MKEKLFFQATLAHCKVTRTGDAKITLEIPLSDRTQALKLALLTERILNIQIEEGE